MRKSHLSFAAGVFAFCLVSCGLTKRKALNIINKEINRPEYFQLKVGEILPMPNANHDINHKVGYGYLMNSNKAVEDSRTGKDTIWVRDKMNICTGCPHCYSQYKQAGLIEYEIYPDGRAIRVALTSEGERYAVHNGGDTYIYMGTPKATRLAPGYIPNTDYRPKEEYTFPVYYEELSPFMKALGNKEKVETTPISISRTAARFIETETGWKCSLGPTYNGHLPKTF